RLGDLTGLVAMAAIGHHAGQARKRLWAARGRMRLGLEGEGGAGRADRKTLVALSLPHRREPVAKIVVAELIEQQQILALAILRAANQRDVALAGGDTRQRDTRRVEAGGFLAHEGA